MKGNRIHLFVGALLLALLCGALLCCGASAEEERTFTASAGTFSGNEKVNAELEGPALLGPWYYDPSTLPEGFTAYNDWDFIRLTRKGKDDQATPDRYSVELITGNPALKDALAFEEQPGSQGEKYVVLLVRSEKITEPGEAVFHLRFGAGNLYYETDYTLRVLSWEEYPLYTLNTGSLRVVVQQAEGTVPDDYYVLSSNFSLTGYYTRDQLQAMLFTDHTDEILHSVIPAEELPVSKSRNDRLQIYTIGRDSEHVYEGLVADREIDLYVDGKEIIAFLSPGSYGIELRNPWVGIIAYATCDVLSWRFSGPTSLTPGGEGIYEVRDSDASSGRTFTLTLTGEGAELDPDNGVLTVSPEAEEGTKLVITAEPSDGGTPLSVTCTVTTGLIAGKTLQDEYLLEGFTVPVLTEESGFDLNRVASYAMISRYQDESTGNRITLKYQIVSSSEFMEDTAVANGLYDTGRNILMDHENYQEETVDIDGHPALLARADFRSSEGDYSNGYLFYVRNNMMLRIVMGSDIAGGASLEQVPGVSISDMRYLAERIKYDPSQASITVADGEISISTKNSDTVLTAGKRLAFTAAFANPDKVNQKAGNNDIIWSVVEAESGETPEGLKMDAQGNLSADKSLTEVRKVKVTASSPIFHTQGEYDLTVMPVVKGVTVDPGELKFFDGESREEIVRAMLSPETVPAIGLVWQAKPAGIVELETNEDGTVSVKPLKAGKATLTVKESGGKSAKLTVNVLVPVEAVELQAKGTAKSGGTVTCTAKLTPKNAGDKSVEWSINVGDDVATINEKGKLTISKTAEAGTVITVTCKATGAPEPVVSTMEITIQEK